jgi:hypothetical protein
MAEPNLGVESSTNYPLTFRALSAGRRTASSSMDWIRKFAILVITIAMLAVLWPILLLDKRLEVRRIGKMSRKDARER